MRIRFDFDPPPEVKDDQGFRNAVMVLLRDRQRIETLMRSEGVDVARKHANTLARDAASLAALLVGEELLHAALLRDKVDDDPLRVIWHRLEIARPLIGAKDDSFFLDLYCPPSAPMAQI